MLCVNELLLLCVLSLTNKPPYYLECIEILLRTRVLGSVLMRAGPCRQQ